MKSMGKRTVALAVLALAAALFLIATYGTALPVAPFSPVKLDGPLSADSDGKLSVVADTESSRVLILNADGDLTGVVDCTTFDSPIEVVDDVCVSDGRVFVSGVKRAPGTSDPERLRVAEYDKGGNLQGTVIDLDVASDATVEPKGLSESDGGVVFARVESRFGVGEDAGRMDALRFLYADGEQEREDGQVDVGDIGLHDVGFSSQDGTYVTLSSRGVLDDGGADGRMTFSDRTFTSIDLGAPGLLLACDDASGALCAISADGDVRELLDGSGYEDVHVNGDVASVCDYDADRVVLCDADGAVRADFTSVKPSLGYSLRMSLVWASGLYLFVLAVALLVRRARRAIASGSAGGIGAMLASVAVVVALGSAIGVMSHSAYQSSLEGRMHEVAMTADYLSTQVGSLGESMERCDDRDAVRAGIDGDRAADLESVSSQAAMLTAAADLNGVGLYYVLYGKDDEGIFYLADSSSDRVLGASVPASNSGALAEAFAEPSGIGDAIQEGRTRDDVTRYRLVSVPSSDGQGVAGVIEVGAKIRSFDASVHVGLAQQLLTLLVMMLVVYLTYSELRACGRCLFTYRRLQERRARDAIAALTRPFTFAITMLSSIDAVMTVLIARELLEGAGLGGSGPLLALPAVMLGVGLVVGQVAYGALGSRVGLRRLVVAGACAMLICSALTAAAVASGNFWLYCAAKLAMSVPFGMLYALGYSLPRIALSDEARAAAAGGVKRTDTSAAALGTVLGGYAAQMLGNAWVYALVGLAAVFVIAMALGLLPKGAPPLEGLHARSSAGSAMLRFVRGRQALCIALLVVLPAAVAAGYASFLFPLFSADLGLTKAQINNIYVIGQLVVYVCISRIGAQEERFGKWRTTTAALALLGAVFLLFSLNTTLVWSVAVVAIVGVLCKASDGWKALWLASAAEAGMPAGPATGAMFAVRSLVLVAQPFILGGLLMATDSLGVIVIGVLCVLCAALFFALTKRSSLPG